MKPISYYSDCAEFNFCFLMDKYNILTKMYLININLPIHEQKCN